MLLPWLAPLSAATSMISQSILHTSDSSPSTKPTVYLIRHAEKDSGIIGLNETGWARAHCLPNVFGPQSSYDIGYIIAQQPFPNGTYERSLQTVTPLAASLNLTVDISCDKYNPECVANLVRSYTGPGNILVAWQHGQLRRIMEQLGGQEFPKYPYGRNDIIWTASKDWTHIEDVRSECCPGLDTC